MEILYLVIILLIVLIYWLRNNKLERYFNYINEMGENEDTVKLFCKKLRYLDTPNEHNILIKKFYDEVINKNSMMKYVDKKNKYKLKTHLQTKNQLSAIELAKKNINSNNVKINLV